MEKKRIVVGMSGASGAPLAVRLLKELNKYSEIETHLVMSKGAELTVEQECSESVSEVISLADFYHDNANIGASIASGSFMTEGMVVIPCSMKTLSGIAHGYSDNLLLRAADVVMKEQRRLVVVPRETPLSVIHLDNLSYIAKVPGVMVIPPVLTYYHNPVSIADMENQLVGKILRCFGITPDSFSVWTEGTN